MLTSARTWARLHGVEGSKPLIDDKRADRSESYETERSRGWILPRRRKGVGEGELHSGAAAAAASARRRANVIVALKAISPARNRFSKVLCNLASLY